MVGTADPFLKAEERALLEDATVRGRYDIRAVETDHFVPWRHPEVVSDVVVEALSHQY